MRRSVWITGVVVGILVLLAIEAAQAQVYFGVGRGYGDYGAYGYGGYGYRGWGGPSVSYGWGGRTYYGPYYGRYYNRYYGGWNPGYVYSYPSYGYGYYPYTGSVYYYGTPQVYSPPVTYNSGIATAPDQPSERRSFYSGPQDLGNKVLLKVQVPKADARLWVEGQEMPQESGLQRSFMSPPLEPGKRYEYTVRATWKEGGQEVSRERKVPVEPGQQVAVILREDDDSGTATPATGQPSNPNDDTSGPGPQRNPSNPPPP